MPNWTACKIDVYCTDKDAMQHFLDTVKSEDSNLDFNKIIPMPEILNGTGKGRVFIDGESVEVWKCTPDGGYRHPTEAENAEFERIGYNNWYDWSTDNWGVKWNASEVSVDTWGDYTEITFDSPWDAPIPVFEKMREMFPLVQFEFHWRHEDEHPYPHQM